MPYVLAEQKPSFHSFQSNDIASGNWYIIICCVLTRLRANNNNAKYCITFVQNMYMLHIYNEKTE